MPASRSHSLPNMKRPWAVDPGRSQCGHGNRRFGEGNVGLSLAPEVPQPLELHFRLLRESGMGGGKAMVQN